VSGIHSSDKCANYAYFVGFEVFTAVVMKSLPPACLLVFDELISSILKMEAICSSETSVETQWTTRRHIPEGDTLYAYFDRNLYIQENIVGVYLCS
jgi:hypothetical protein